MADSFGANRMVGLLSVHEAGVRDPLRRGA
jgi:hypothetical protein